MEAEPNRLIIRRLRREKLDFGFHLFSLFIFAAGVNILSHIVRRTQIPFIIFNLSIIVYNFIGSVARDVL